jgi:lipopolysaccharide transport system ATP-binding protein
VGDASFQAKCHDALTKFHRAGKSLLFVSHAASQVLEMCERAIWLDHGKLMMEGAAGAVLDAYASAVALQEPAAPTEPLVSEPRP